MSPLVKKISLFVGSILFALVLTEFCLRYANKNPAKQSSSGQWIQVPESTWTQYHPILGWFHQPKKTALLHGNKSLPVNINSIGLRGSHEYALSKADGILRACAIGDSFTFGFGVRDEQSFPAQMETLGRNWKVMNFGVCGYGIDQMYLLLRELGFQYAPDIVLITIFPEDFWRATRAYTEGYGKPFFVLQPDGSLVLQHSPVPKTIALMHSQFPEITKLRPIQRVLTTSHLYRFLCKVALLFKKRLGWEDPDSSQEWILGRAILRRMTEEIKLHHIRPIIVIAPPHRWIKGTVEPLRDSLLRFGKKNGVEVIDLTPTFKKAFEHEPLENLYIKDDHHWTPKGHKLVAITLFQTLSALPQSREAS